MTPRLPLAALALAGLFLTPLAARADHWDGRGRSHGRYHHGPVVVVQRPVPQVPPPAPAGQYGRYELRTVNQLIPGHYEQVWVEQSCRSHPFKPWKTRCAGGYYDQRWVADAYVPVQQWVWVASAPAAYAPTGY